MLFEETGLNAAENTIDLNFSHENMENIVQNAANNFAPPHWEEIPDLRPNLKEYDRAYDFKVEYIPEDPNEKNTDQIFSKMGSAVNINISYRPKIPNELMYVRAMIVFTDPVHRELAPSRCANHKQNSNEPYKDHILKCSSFNPSQLVSYNGNASFNQYGHRLSVVTLFSRDLQTDDDGKISEKFMYTFGCRNTCGNTAVKRRNASILFTLEDYYLQRYGSYLIPFKISALPNRDAKTYAKNSGQPRAKIQKRSATQSSTSKRTFGTKPAGTQANATIATMTTVTTTTATATETTTTETVSVAFTGVPKHLVQPCLTFLSMSLDADSRAGIETEAHKITAKEIREQEMNLHK